MNNDLDLISYGRYMQFNLVLNFDFFFFSKLNLSRSTIEFNVIFAISILADNFFFVSQTFLINRWPSSSHVQLEKQFLFTNMPNQFLFCCRGQISRFFGVGKNIVFILTDSWSFFLTSPRMDETLALTKSNCKFPFPAPLLKISAKKFLVRA